MGDQIKSYGRGGLERLVGGLGQKPFRARQLEEWLYVHHVSSYDAMTNLPLKFREALAREHPLFMPRVAERKVSSDGTRKYLLELFDGACIETVAIPSLDGDRLTVCFSTQVGCSMACSFCATGMEGFSRNLLPGEMLDEVQLVQEDMGARVSNLVAMGQGEPFLNYDNVLDALRIVNDPKGIAIGARHITLSTCGICPGIERLAAEPEQFTLAISLHSAVQETRNALMPRVASFPLPKLRCSLESYLDQTNRRVSFEYLMIKGLNDDERHLSALCSYCKGLLCHVNLIPLNEVEGSPFSPSSPRTMRDWTGRLKSCGIETTVRTSRGGDVSGACGQLKQTSFVSRETIRRSSAS